MLITPSLLIPYPLPLYAGSRLFAACTSGILFPMSFWMQLISQSYVVYMTRGNDSLCSAELMTDPLTIERLRIFISLTSQVLLPTATMEPLLPAGSECSFIFTLLHLLFGVVWPSLSSLLLAFRSNSSDRQRPSRILIWWVGLIVTWAMAVLITSYTAGNIPSKLGHN